MPVDSDDLTTNSNYTNGFDSVLNYLHENSGTGYTDHEITAELYDFPLEDDGRIDIVAQSNSIDDDLIIGEQENLTNEEAIKLTTVTGAVDNQVRYVELIAEHLCYDDSEPVEFGFDSEGIRHYFYTE